MTRSLRLLLVLPAALAAACAGGDSSAADAALQKDIALASQMSPYQPQQFVSPGEMGYNPYAQPYGQPMPNGAYPQQYYPQPAPMYQPAPVYQPAARPATTTRRTSTASRSSGTRSTGSSAGTVVQREPRIIRNTKRDAVIGAAAGAVLGAATSRDRVKGAVIGGVAGGVLGGIIGHTIDVKRQ